MRKNGLSQRVTTALTLAALCFSITLTWHPLRADPAVPRQDDLAYLEPVLPNRIDQAQLVMTDSVNDAARWLDSFFLDERFVAEEAYTRIRLAPGIFFEEGEAARLKLRLNAKLSVPHFNRKLRFTISGDTEDTPDEAETGGFTTSPENNEEQANIGLEYIFRDKKKLNTSLSTGIKLGHEHGLDLFIGPRVRKTFVFDLWQMRFTERIRWYTDIGWESVTRFDFERALPDELLFRGTVDGRWREEDPGYRYELRPTLFKPLTNRAAIEYQWNNVFVTRPNHTLDAVNLRVRYRKQKWRRWLYFEINPQLAFRNDDDFRPTPGIEFRLEATFGGLDPGPRPQRDAAGLP